MPDIAALLLAGAATLACESPRWSFALRVADEVCAINGDEGYVAARAPVFECRVSNPQLRILTVEADGAFLYADTDDDSEVRGRCQPAS